MPDTRAQPDHDQLSRRDLAWAAGVAFFALLASAGLQYHLLSGGPNAASAGDAAMDFFPNLWLYDRSLAEGRIPFWSFYDNVGRPLFAEGYRGFLHPLTLLAYGAFPFDIAFVFHAIFPPVIGAVGMYFLCRTVGVEEWGAAFAGVAFTLNGFVQSYAPAPPLMTAYMVFPAAFAFALLLLRDPRAQWVAGLALMFGLTGLGGYPVVLWWLSVGVGFFAVAEIAVNRRPVRRLALVLIAMVAGYGVAAVQLLPTVELLSRSALTTAPLTEHFHLSGSFPPSSVAGYLLAREHGLFSRFGSYGWTGQVVTILAIVALFLRDKRRVPWMVAGIAVAVVALGKYTPFFYLWEQLPFAALFRLPARALMIMNVIAVVLAAIAMDEILRHGRTVRPSVLRGTVAVAGVIAAVAALPYVLPQILRWTSSFADGSYLYIRLVATDAGKALAEYSTNPSLLKITPSHLGLIPAVTIGGVLLLVHTGGPRCWRFGVVAILALSAVAQQIGYRWESRREAITPVDLHGCELADYLRGRTGDQRVVTFPEHPSSPPIVGYVTTRGLCSVDADVNLLHGLLSANHHHFSLSTRGYYEFMFGEGEPLLDRLQRAAVRYVVVDQSLEDALRPDERRLLARLDQDRCFGDNCVYVVPSPLPLVFVSDSVRTLDGRVRVFGNPEHVAATLRPNKIIVYVDVDSPSELVISQLEYPGWHATVDRRRTLVGSPDELLQTVPVSPGERRVEFSFRPQGLAAGIVVTVASLVALCLITLQGLLGRYGGLTGRSAFRSDRRGRQAPATPSPEKAGLLRASARVKLQDLSGSSRTRGSPH